MASPLRGGHALLLRFLRFSWCARMHFQVNSQTNASAGPRKRSQVTCHFRLKQFSQYLWNRLIGQIAGVVLCIEPNRVNQ